MESQVHLTIPADTAFVSMVRTATAAVCAQADFTLDAIEDLRLAIDEACALVIADAPDASDISIVWITNGHELRIDVSAASRSGAAVSRDSFAWTVLSALVDEVDAVVDAGRQRISLRAHGVESVAL